MMEKNKDTELRRELKRIGWKKYLDYGIVEIRVRSGQCKTIDIRRTYTENNGIKVYPN